MLPQGIYSFLPLINGPVIIYLAWVAQKRNVILGKNFADPTIKKVKIFFTQPQILIKK
jgi:hypothetical protein